MLKRSLGFYSKLLPSMCGILLVSVAIAGGEKKVESEPVQREIFVPYADLHVLLDNDPSRVFMSRDEYEKLAEQAKQGRLPEDTKQPAAVLSADYVAKIEENRTSFVGTLVVTAPDENLSAVELDLSGVSLRSATLDDQPAPLGRNPAGIPILFVRGVGRHTLKLELFAPVETAAAQRTLSFQVPTPPAAKLRLTVPGNVEIKGGATIIRREHDEAAQTTAFDLLPRRGQNNLVLSLNNRQLQKDQVVVAHSVLFDEITTAYERLHVTMSLTVLHGAAEQFQFEVPSGFEVLSVAAPQVAKWAVSKVGDKAVLEVRLHEPTSETISINIMAVRTPANYEDWHLPKLTALDVASQATVIGLLVENRLKPQDLRPRDLIAIDAEVLQHTAPESFGDKADGRPIEAALAAYFAPRSDYDLQGRFIVPPAELRVTTGVFLSLTEKSLEARGSFSLVSGTEKLLVFDFFASPGWQVIEVTPDGGGAVPFESFPAAEGRSRIHVKLPQAKEVGQAQTVYFRALRTPDGWLEPWESRQLEFPVFEVIGATADTGAIAVQATDDLRARPEKTERLTPLDAVEKTKYGLADVPTEMAFRYDAPPYVLTLTASRVAPRLTAKVFSFFRVEPDFLAVHNEINFEVTEARTSRLSFTLPLSTPAEVSIRALDGVTVKESNSEPVGNERRWTVQLAEQRMGAIRLAVDFQQPLEEKKLNDLRPPLLKALDVTYQLGTIAVEGNAEQDVEVKTKLRKVDVGELAEAEYRPDRRLLGAYGYGGEQAELQLAVVRPPGYDLPSVLVERAELVTSVSASGKSQTAARFQLRAKAQMIELRLPDGSTLWSVHLDHQPVLPQRQANSLLIDLPATADAVRRDLQVVYETPVSALGLSSRVDLDAPRLFLRASGTTASTEVPLANLLWRFHTPDRFQIVRSTGTVFSDEIRMQPSPVRIAAGTVLDQLASVERKYSIESDRGSMRSAPTTAAPAEAPAVMSEPATGANSFDIDSNGPVPANEESSLNRTANSSLETSDESRDDPFESGQRGVGQRPADAPATPAVQSPIPATALNDLNQSQLGRAHWAFEGIRSLPIDLQIEGTQVAFQSLGESPELSVTIVDNERFRFLAWGIGLLVFLRGVALTNAPPSRRFRYLVIIITAALALPIALPWFSFLAPVCELVFFAGCWLVAYYVIVAIVKRLLSVGHFMQQRLHAAPKAPAVASLLLLLATSVANAEEPPPAPVHVPADAIIVPYDPAIEDPLQFLSPPVADPEDGQSTTPDKFGSDGNRKILVPYKTYLELRKAAKLDGGPEAMPPAAYALAGAKYSATLDSEDSLLLDGQLQIDLFVDHAVNIPIPLVGGVLTKVTADGQDKSATLGVLPVVTPTNEKTQGKIAKPIVSGFLLVLSGKGRHRIDLSARFQLQRRGGWQIAEGRLPGAPATAVSLRVSKSATEVQIAGGVDRGIFESKQDGETIETALPADGNFHIQWRPKTARAPVDQSLTTESNTIFDVQEDGLRLNWTVNLSFRRDQRDSFTLELPENYLVEKVSGANVRGWKVDEVAGSRKLEVTLLKAAQESETFSVSLARYGSIGIGNLTDFSVPTLSVAGAAQHSGEVTIRRSPLIELRTQDIQRATRADNAANRTSVAAADSPLGIVPFQSYRFADTPFTISLTARPVAPRIAAELQTVLKISERQRMLESRIRLRVQDRSLYRLRVAIPTDWKLDQVVAPKPFEWVVTKEQGRHILDLYLATGQQKTFDVLLFGSLGQYGQIESLDLPKLEVLQPEGTSAAIEQSGQIVVQVDPALNVRTEKLVDCETDLLSRVTNWLAAEQRSLARLALSYRSPKYSGTLRLTRRTPIVHCDTITNVRVTQRTVEETILLDFNIREAGIREVSFLLPETMRDARINAPFVRQKTIEPVADAAGSRIRVRLALQDEVMNSYRVLVENDRLLTGQTFAAPIPQVETGETDHRYVALESAGRDEVLVETSEAVDPLRQEQSEWRMLVDLLGRGLTQAYLVRSGSAQPKLVLKSQDRATVETVGARIGLAKTMLILDPNGAYRAAQTYRVDNSLEQYLEVQLPAGARLWTAHVAGEPVKPAATKSADVVRIPLVKTAMGDADYAVLLKYGGELGKLETVDQLSLPFIQTRNINVELSQVELYVPETHKWFNFGGTMRLVASEGDLAAGELAYNNKQLGLALQVLRSEDEYARARALNNYKALQQKSSELKESSRRFDDSKELEKQILSNTSSLQLFDAELKREERQKGSGAFGDNRGRLNERFSIQTNDRASEVVNSAGKNFNDVDESLSQSAKEGGGQGVNKDWLIQNKLDSTKKQGEGKPMSREALEGDKSGKDAQQGYFDRIAGPSGGRGASALPQKAESSDQKQKRNLDRYQRQLEEQQLSVPQSNTYTGPTSGWTSQSPYRRGESAVATPQPTVQSGRGGQSPVSQPQFFGGQVQIAQPVPQRVALASLDVEFEPRGVRYLFTTPRGDVQVTAQAVSESVVGRVLRLCLIALTLIILLTIAKRFSHRNRPLFAAP